MIFVFPNEDIHEEGTEEKVKGMRPATPLLVLASYLEGKYSRQQLVQILGQFKNSRHFYSPYFLPVDAPLGRYQIRSEFISEGVSYSSSTQEEDFFLVEQLEVLQIKDDKDGKYAVIQNLSLEPVTTSLINVQDSIVKRNEVVIPAKNTVAVHFDSEPAFIEYCDGQVCIPLLTNDRKLCLPNSEWSAVKKPDQNLIWVMEPKEDKAFELEADYAALWEKVNTRTFVAGAPQKQSAPYQEMLQEGLLLEI